MNEVLRLSLTSDGALIGTAVVAVLLALLGAAVLGRHRDGLVRRLAAVLLVLVLPVAGVMAVGGLLINRQGSTSRRWGTSSASTPQSGR